MPARRATADDIDHIIALGAAFHDEHGVGPQGFNAGDFGLSVAATIERGAVFLSDGGAIGLAVAPSFLDHSKRLALELFFWAPDGRGDELRKAAEAWAADNADALIMSAHEPAERAANWYRRKGYAPIGRQFAKVF